jgi:hypothetical protein
LIATLTVLMVIREFLFLNFNSGAKVRIAVKFRLANLEVRNETIVSQSVLYKLYKI